MSLKKLRRMFKHKTDIIRAELVPLLHSPMPPPMITTRSPSLKGVLMARPRVQAPLLARLNEGCRATDKVARAPAQFRNCGQKLSGVALCRPATAISTPAGTLRLFDFPDSGVYIDAGVPQHRDKYVYPRIIWCFQMGAGTSRNIDINCKVDGRSCR